MSDSVAGFTQKNEAANDNISRIATQFQKFLEKIDPATKAGRQYSTEMEKLNDFQRAGVVSTSDLSIAQQALRTRFEGTSSSATFMSQALGVAKTALGALGIGFGVDAIVRFTTESLRSAAALNNEAAVAGVSTRALQAYQLAAIESGTKSDVANEALRRFTRSLGEAADAPGPTRKALQDLGFTSDVLAGGTESALPKVARALLGIKDASERARLEVILFQRSGQEVEGFLRTMAQGTETLAERFERMGLIISESTIERMDKAQARIDLFFAGLKTGVVDFIDFITSEKARMEWAAGIADRIAKGFQAPPAGSAGRPGTTSRSVIIPIGAAPGSEFAVQNFANTALGAIQQGQVAASGVSILSPDTWKRLNTELASFNQKLEEQRRLIQASDTDRERSAAFIAAAMARERDLHEQDSRHVVENVTTEARARQLLQGVMHDATQTEAEYIDKTVDGIAKEKLAKEALEGRAAAQRAATEAVKKFNEETAKSTSRELDQRVRTEINQLTRLEDPERRRQETFKEMLAQIEEQTKLYGLSTKEAEKQYVIAQAEKRLGPEMTQDQKDQLALAVEQRQQAEQLAEERQAMIHAWTNWFEEIARTGKVNFRSLASAILDVWAQTLGKMLQQWIENQLLMKNASAANAGGGGLFGFGLTNLPTLFNVGSLFNFGGARASGGPVQRGKVYDVGESGPEKFSPNVDGYVWPNGASGAQPILLHLRVEASDLLHAEIDQRSSRNAQAVVIAYDRQVMPARVIDVVTNPRRR